LSHISKNYYTEKLDLEVGPLPKNTTNYCQLLAVDVMELLKAKNWSMWLADTMSAKTTLEKEKLAIQLSIAA
jgi:hypothetical protein